MRSQALISEVVLNDNSIVAALFTRGRDEGFHWMLALPGAGEEPGADLKLHVNNPRGRWQFQAGDHNLPQSETLHGHKDWFTGNGYPRANPQHRRRDRYGCGP